MSVFVVFQHAS